ncbi:MAG: Ig-like domain-containing protein, partial [Lachnospiraceae bacterium]|nr:Ig-like domain-containing protein [Lachnospiraceae bacterium]
MNKYGKKLLSSVLAASMVFSSATTTMLATAVPVFADEAQAAVAVTGITLSMDAISGKPGQMSQISATVSPEDAADKTIAWTTSDESVVSLWGEDDNYTFFTLNATGTATITATCGGVSASVPVTVLVDPMSVTEVAVTPSEVTLNPGETVQLSAATTPAGAGIIWESTANSIAAVDAWTGVVTAKEAGTATIKAMIDGREGMYGTCTVTVNPQETGLTWKIEDGTLIVSGSGEMEDHDWEDAYPWFDEKNNFTRLVVEEGVTTVGSNAFSYYSNLAEATLPSTLTTLKECAFFYCTSLRTLNMGGNAPALTGWGQLSGCKELTINVPAGATGYDVAPWTSYNVVEVGDEEAPVSTYAIDCSSIMRDTGKPSGMYTFENAIVTEQEDGTYLVRMHQASVNRNVIALTDDKAAAKDHTVDWYIGGGADGYWFTIPVASLDETLYAVMSSESRIAAGNDFSNVIAITFDKDSMTATEEAPAVAEDMNINPAIPVEVVTPYTVTANNTAMFKVVDAYMKEIGGTKTLYITLNGTGYHSLFKGTYEQAVATGADETQWINGVIRADETAFNGKYEFAIPVEDGDSYIQINARSFSKGTWYPRYIKIDQAAATLEAGDYAETFDLAVTNQNDAEVLFAEMSVTGGPNSNNYLVTATVGLPGFVQAYVGSADEAAAATEGFIDSAIGEFTIQVEKLLAPGSTALDTIMDQPTAVSFKDADGNWAEYTLTFSKANKTLTADYQAPVAAFSVDPAEITVNVGETFELSTVNGDPRPGTYTYFWYNPSDQSIAQRVGNAYGVTKQYKAIAAGDTTIKVVWDEPYITSECIVHVVDPTPKATAIVTDPVDFHGVIGDTASFSVEADGEELVYQWYYSKNGTKWYKSTVTGNDTAEISFKVTSVNKNNIYKCVVTGADEVSVTSYTAAVVVPQAAVIIKQPETAVAAKGQTATFSVVADYAVSYQWYYTKDGEKWYKSTAEGADTAEFSIKVSSSNEANVYRCKVTGEDGAVVISEEAGISLVEGAVIITQPVSAEASIGDTVSFTVEAQNAVSYQWYYSKDGAKWFKSSVTGFDTAAITLKKSASNAANKYRCKIIGTDGNAIYTDVV